MSRLSLTIIQKMKRTVLGLQLQAQNSKPPASPVSSEAGSSDKENQDPVYPPWKPALNQLSSPEILKKLTARNDKH